MRPGNTLTAVLAQAARQDGAISLAQLAACGMQRGAVDHRVATGWLQRVHRGVFLVGPVAGPLAYEHAAVLACGESAVVSHRSAGAVWDLVPARTGIVEVTLTEGHRRSQPGIVVHQAPLRRDEVSRSGDLHVTSPARTLLDLAAQLPRSELERAANEALALGATTPAAVRGLLARTARHQGRAALQAAFADEPRLTRSDLERRLLALVERAGLPAPRVNASLLGFTVDFFWPAERLVVETDGFGVHGSRRRFESDRARDAALQASGYRVLRFTWRQLTDTPELVVARLATVLARVAA
jgi:very-short-patch-repair endonuclease